MAVRNCLTVERLRELLDYDPETGIFRWKKNLKGGVRVGDIAGCDSEAGSGIVYRRIRIDDVLYHAHRLAWFYVYEEWPRGVIDHRRDHSNRIDNLRECTQRSNTANAKKRRDNTSGFKGVTKRTNTIWIAQLNGHLGCFRTAEEAAKAYDAAAIAKYGEFAKTNKSLGLLP